MRATFVWLYLLRYVYGECFCSLPTRNVAGRMSVVLYRCVGQSYGPRQFAPPKRAGELKYWYKAAKKMLPILPDWQDSFALNADVEVDSIILTLPEGTVLIARKKNL